MRINNKAHELANHMSPKMYRYSTPKGYTFGGESSKANRMTYMTAEQYQEHLKKEKAKKKSSSKPSKAVVEKPQVEHRKKIVIDSTD